MLALNAWVGPRRMGWAGVAVRGPGWLTLVEAVGGLATVRGGEGYGPRFVAPSAAGGVGEMNL